VEVVLVREDDEPLLFDIASVPVLKLPASDASTAARLLRSALVDRFAERDLRKIYESRRHLRHCLNSKSMSSDQMRTSDVRMVGSIAARRSRHGLTRTAAKACALLHP
jgi:hypothetical protein